MGGSKVGIQLHHTHNWLCPFFCFQGNMFKYVTKVILKDFAVDQLFQYIKLNNVTV